jgi:hypothetical protein
MSAKKYAPRNQFTKREDRIFQTFTVASCVSRPWRTEGPALAIRQITTQHGYARAGEGFG